MREIDLALEYRLDALHLLPPGGILHWILRRSDVMNYRIIRRKYTRGL